eukprot:gene9213-10173_t
MTAVTGANFRSGEAYWELSGPLPCNRITTCRACRKIIPKNAMVMEMLIHVPSKTVAITNSSNIMRKLLQICLLWRVQEHAQMRMEEYLQGESFIQKHHPQLGMGSGVFRDTKTLLKRMVRISGKLGEYCVHLPQGRRIAQ